MAIYILVYIYDMATWLSGYIYIYIYIYSYMAMDGAMLYGLLLFIWLYGHMVV